MSRISLGSISLLSLLLFAAPRCTSEPTVGSEDARPDLPATPPLDGAADAAGDGASPMDGPMDAPGDVGQAHDVLVEEGGVDVAARSDLGADAQARDLLPPADSTRDLGPSQLQGQNPVLPGSHGDPHVTRVVGADGKPTYYLVHTVGNASDIPLYRSRDLLSWTREPKGLFDRARTPGSSLDVNQGHFCAIWAPQIVAVPGSFLLSFSAQRYTSAQASCPPYNDDGGVYLASSTSITGPYAPSTRSWEPLSAGAHRPSCADTIRDAIPRSLDIASRNCQGGFCHQIIRLDSDVFHDETTGRYWLGYSWFTNSPPVNEWERQNHGEHTSVVELDASDPYAVRCDANVAQIHVANPQDSVTRARLAASCVGCDQMLSFTRGRFDEEVVHDGVSWGVVEGVNFFRRGEYIYAMISGSLWDSGYYHVYWTAAKTMAGLSYTNPQRLVGRYLIPSQDMAFGHGTAVLGPDGTTWYFVYHRLRHADCRDTGDCGRDVWVSKIDFVDKGDGLGAVHIAPRWPAADPSVVIELR